MKQLVILLSVLALASGGCGRSSDEKPLGKPVKIAACDLVTADEVAAIQGTTISGTNKSEGAIGSLLATQCYYTSNEPNKSVTVAVIQQQAGQADDPARFWRETFTESGEEKESSKDKKGNREEEEKKRTPPRKITGIGDEAYWAATAIGGTFYVLKKDKHVFLRISVGGPDPIETKLEKSEKIAESALKRL